MKRALVTGASGFIGSHLVNYLKAEGYWVRGVDIKHPEFMASAADNFQIRDLRRFDAPFHAMSDFDFDEVYALAADMGGMGYISNHHVEIMHANTLINVNTLRAAIENHVPRFFFASSACIYPEYRQDSPIIEPLREEDAFPAQPQDGYGWEKLYAEQMLLYHAQTHPMQVRIARFHNIYGPYGTWQGGREKVPAALCRKVAMAKHTGINEIEIWGDGEQTRSFCHVHDCVEGIYRLMQSDYSQPLNIGSDRMVSINQLADIVMDVAGVKLDKRHVDGPQGVRGRNSDNTRCEEVLGWSPSIGLEEGIRRTYAWVEAQVSEALEVQV